MYSIVCVLLKYVRIMRIFHATQTRWGAVQTALVRADLDVYVSPTSTNGARCGDRWSYHSGTRAVNIGRRGQGCFNPHLRGSVTKRYSLL